MKKTKIIAIASFFAICISMFAVYNYANNGQEVDTPDEEMPQITEPEIEQTEEQLEESSDLPENMIIWSFDHDVLGENQELLLESRCSLPKSILYDEFAENFNAYYTAINSKINQYMEYEGSDLAQDEKVEFGEDFYPLNYTVSFSVEYEDDELISIKRETTMYSNETDFYEISTETFSKIDGTLVLVSDICPDILVECQEFFETSVSSLEDFKFNVTSEGIWCKNNEIDGIIPFSEINLAENYQYLGETNATD